jgi:DNA-binding NtrC family response regulator
VATATVLVVDDEVTQRAVLQRWLEQWGYTHRLVDGARAALEAMLSDPADVLLVDLKMPDRDGFWLIERVRTKWPRAAIIVATGMLDMDVVARAKRLGAVDFVSKPFGRELLHQALERAEQQRAHAR